jgi:hypothetical protein
MASAARYADTKTSNAFPDDAFDDGISIVNLGALEQRGSFLHELGLSLVVVQQFEFWPDILLYGASWIVGSLVLEDDQPGKLLFFVELDLKSVETLMRRDLVGETEDAGSSVRYLVCCDPRDSLKEQAVTMPGFLAGFDCQFGFRFFRRVGSKGDRFGLEFDNIFSTWR